MKKFNLEVEMENSDFDELEGIPALDTIFRNVLEDLGDGETEGTIRDSNGNIVGSYSITNKE